MLAVEPGVFVAAAEHERSESWRRIYGGNNADTPSVNPKPKRSDEHAVRIALLWGHFKGEVKSGHPPPAMLPPNTDRVMVCKQTAALPRVSTSVDRRLVLTGAPPYTLDRSAIGGGEACRKQDEGGQEVEGQGAGGGFGPLRRPAGGGVEGHNNKLDL